MRFKPVRLVVFLLVIGAIFGARWAYTHHKFPKGKSESSAPSVAHTTQSIDGVTPIRVCVVTWGGYAGGEYFNNGFKANKESRFWTEYGVPVEFVLQDDFEKSRQAWKAGRVDLLWITADSYPTETAGLTEYDPRIVFQADWSRGGDVAIAVRDITSVADLRGKRGAYAYGTPSNTLLLNMLKSGGMTLKDIVPVQVPSAIDAAAAFKDGKVDFAIVWSPDDEACLSTVQGSHVLWSSAKARNIIADVFYAKEEFIQSHQKELAALVTGWLRGAAEINTDPEARQKAATILAQGLNISQDDALKSMSKARLCTYGDNMDFFGLTPGFKGVKGEELYTKTGAWYEQIGLAAPDRPAWRQVIDLSILQSVTSLTSAADAAEGGARFTPATPELAQSSAFATKHASVYFPTGSAILTDAAKSVIDKEFADIARNNSGVHIRVEGNTDATGTDVVNIPLSKHRANAVVNYLVQAYQFDRNRFIVVGNGSTKPISDVLAENRRTDFELLAQ